MLTQAEGTPARYIEEQHQRRGDNRALKERLVVLFLRVETEEDSHNEKAAGHHHDEESAEIRDEGASSNRVTRRHSDQEDDCELPRNSQCVAP